jgi:hypothetical protein
MITRTRSEKYQRMTLEEIDRTIAYLEQVIARTRCKKRGPKAARKLARLRAHRPAAEARAAAALEAAEKETATQVEDAGDFWVTWNGSIGRQGKHLTGGHELIGSTLGKGRGYGIGIGSGGLI